jgi:uncharacterized protein (TIGR02600 family)
MKKKANRRGIALVLVLSFLVLISVLTVAFFSSITTELSASKTYADTAGTKMLADSAINLVMGTIKEATTQTNATWASQPGMIRAYGANAAPVAYYKLYSSDKFVVTDHLASYDPSSDVEPLWDQQAALYTDLNSPVFTPDPSDSTKTKPVFPIIDPRAMSATTGSSIEGFSYQKNNVDGVVEAGANADDQRLPMPARWLYLLKDGSIACPTGITNGAAIFGGDVIPSTANPIVGRIAFWTDDETCKININTAAGDLPSLDNSASGSFWDIPRIDSVLDHSFATSQPFQYEFQRYPGHPATISLSTVFPNLTRANVETIAPRIVGGGSEGGTIQTSQTTLPALVPDADRLYTSVDELLFSAPPYSSGTARPFNPTLDRDQLERARFFVTATSRAPDLNLFGQPRVCIWPLSDTNDTDHRTGTDQLIAFCSTVGGKGYYFTRKDPNSSSTDYSNIPRNQSLYSYLQTATGKAIPGFSTPASGFASKYTPIERDQILTEIFDYIRIINLNDPNVSVPYAAKVAANGEYLPGTAQVVPIEIATGNGNTRGFGRFHTISEAAILFYASSVDSGTATGMKVALLFERFSIAGGYSPIYPNYQYRISTLNSDPMKLTVNGNTNSLVFNDTTNNICNSYHVVTLQASGGVEGVAADFYKIASSGGFYLMDTYPFNSNEVQIPTGCTSFKIQDFRCNLELVSPDGTVVQKIPLHFPETTLPMPIPPPTPSDIGNGYPSDALLTDFHNRMNLGGTDNKVKNFYSWFITKSDVIRSLEIGGTTKGDVRLLFKKFDDNTVPESYFEPHHDYLSGTGTMRAHSLETGLYWCIYEGGSKSALVNANYNIYPAVPSTKQGTYAALNGTPGDWDTGIGCGSDGPMINKTDDGTTSISISGWDPYYGYEMSEKSSDRSTRGKALASPNRQLASAVQFGSLSTGVSRQLPWQTLLFRPDPAGTHPGSTSPKDYLLLDLFTMPVVEPYAISEPLSTAGRVNLNYRIAPYGSYITRSTALRAALKSTMVMAIPTSLSLKYKGASKSADNCRYRIDPDETTGTLKFFEDRFNRNDSNDATQRGLFVSASEICDIPLVPKGSTAAGMSTYWTGKELTGDNVRETPYSHLYPLLTTKSNTYTVHVRVQSLKKVPGTNIAQWVEGRDRVLGEYRGSSVIERYIDPNDSRWIQGNAGYLDPDANSLEPMYRFRVIGTKRFCP